MPMHRKQMRLEVRGGSQLPGATGLAPIRGRFNRGALRDAFGHGLRRPPNYPVAACQAPLLRLDTARH